MDSPGLIDDVEYQIATQGVASYAVKDGQVFVFTTAALTELLSVAAKSDAGRVIVMVKHREAA